MCNVVAREKVAVLTRGTLMDAEMVAAKADASYVMAGLSFVRHFIQPMTKCTVQLCVCVNIEPWEVCQTYDASVKSHSACELLSAEELPPGTKGFEP